MMMGRLRQTLLEDESTKFEGWLKETVKTIIVDCQCLEVFAQLDELADLTDLPVIAKVSETQHRLIK